MRRRGPGRRAVERRRAVAVERVRNGRALARRLGKHFELARIAFRSIALAGPGGDETGDAREPFGAAERANELVEQLIDRRCVRERRDDVGTLHHLLAVQGRKVRRDDGSIARAVTRIAGDQLAPAEIRAVDLGHHRDHAPRGPLSRVRVGGVRVPAGVARGMAVLTRQPQRRGKDPHRPHELIHGDALQHLNVLEDLVCDHRFGFSRGLTMNEREEEHAQQRTRERSDLHATESTIGRQTRRTGAGRAEALLEAAWVRRSFG